MKNFTNSLLLLASLTLCFLGTEFYLRSIGKEPYNPATDTFTTQSESRIEPSEILGWANKPGKKIWTRHHNWLVPIEENDYLEVVQTHWPDSSRATRPIFNKGYDGQEKSIWLFGCSLTYGTSLNDDQTFPWILQERFSTYDIRNYSSGGYGTVQSYLWFQELLESSSTTPDKVILVYASFHDKRNSLLRARGKRLRTEKKNLKVPYAYLQNDGESAIAYKALAYREFPFMRQSVLMNMIEESYNNLEKLHMDSSEISRQIIHKMAQLAKNHNIEFIVAGISRNRATARLLSLLKNQGIKTVNISVNPRDSHYTNKPYNNHPSAITAKRYADALEPVL